MLNILIVVCNGLVTNGNQSSKWEGQWVEQRGLGVDRDVLPRSTVDLFVLYRYQYTVFKHRPLGSYRYRIVGNLDEVFNLVILANSAYIYM